MADGDFDDDERPRKKTRKASATVTKTTRRPSGNVFAKIGMLALIAFIVAGMLTWVIAFSIEELPSIKGFIGRRNYSDLLFFVFLVAFAPEIVTALFTARYLPAVPAFRVSAVGGLLAVPIAAAVLLIMEEVVFPKTDNA